MPILFKPTGSLDINTAPTDLPEQADGKNIVSGAMVRCKNLRLDRHGIASTRYGSTLLVALASSQAPELILEVGGSQYVFAGDQIFYDETAATSGTQAPAPTYSPAGAAYLAEQTVTISCSVAQVEIYYTVDGTTPSTDSILYTAPFLMPGNNYLKAYAVDPRGFLSDSDVTSEYYAIYAQNTLISETDLDTLITETDSDTLTTEGP